MCCGPRREFEMRIYCEYSDFGMGEDMECLRLQRPFKCQAPCCCCLQELTVTKAANARDGQEALLGGIYEECACGGCAAEFRVEDGNGNTVYRIQSPCCPVDGPCCEISFPVMQGEEQVCVCVCVCVCVRARARARARLSRAPLISAFKTDRVLVANRWACSPRRRATS